MPVLCFSPDTALDPRDKHFQAPSLGRGILLPSCAPQSTPPRHLDQHTPAARGTLKTEQSQRPPPMVAPLPGPQHGSRIGSESFWAREGVQPPAQPWALTTRPRQAPVPEQPSCILIPWHRCVSPAPALPSALLPVTGRRSTQWGSNPTGSPSAREASSCLQVLYPNNFQSLALSLLLCLQGSPTGKASAPINVEQQQGHITSPGPLGPFLTAEHTQILPGKPGFGSGALLHRGRIIWRSLRKEAKALKKLPLPGLAGAAGERQAQAVPSARANAGREGGCPRHRGRDVPEGQSKGAGRLGRGCQAGGCRGEQWDGDPHLPIPAGSLCPHRAAGAGAGGEMQSSSGEGEGNGMFSSHTLSLGIAIT